MTIELLLKKKYPTVSHKVYEMDAVLFIFQNE